MIKKVMLSIDSELLTQIDSCSKKYFMSRSEFIKFLFIDFLSKENDILKFWDNLE